MLLLNKSERHVSNRDRISVYEYTNFSRPMVFGRRAGLSVGHVDGNAGGPG